MFTKKLSALLLVGMTLPAAAHAGDYSAVPYLEAAYDAALAADISTTLDIKNHPDQHETNPFLGPHPSDSKIIVIGGVVPGLLHALITHELVVHEASPVLVNIWEAVSIGVEVGAAGHNMLLGLKFKI